MTAIEGIEPGATFATSRRTITEADIVNYAGLSNDFNPLHVDEGFAEPIFGGRIAHGQMIASVVTGLRSSLDEWPVVSLERTERAFRAPVRPGDTIEALYTVAGTEIPPDRPSALLVTVGLEVRGRDGEQVMSGIDVLLLDPEGPGEWGGR